MSVSDVTATCPHCRAMMHRLWPTCVVCRRTPGAPSAGPLGCPRCGSLQEPVGESPCMDGSVLLRCADCQLPRQVRYGYDKETS
jgi:hypothetical protein